MPQRAKGEAKNIASRQDPPQSIRMPRDLLEAIDRHAAANGRSRNTEVVMRLRKSLMIGEAAHG